jgi:hypothetical protein
MSSVEGSLFSKSPGTHPAIEAKYSTYASAASDLDSYCPFISGDLCSGYRKWIRLIQIQFNQPER